MAADRTLERALRRTRSFLEGHGLDWGAGWLVAVSGGADSLALWRLAAALGRQLGFRVEAAHVDHGLRPSAQQEALAVRALAPRLGTSCHVVAVRVRQRGEGPEAAARGARYLALDELCRARGLDLVATGHTADDQAETVLMRLLSGAGLRGLEAMRAIGPRRLRPLLWMRRVEAARLARALEVAPVDDESNRDPRLLRARVRAELLPLARDIFGDPVVHLAALAGEVGGIDALVEQLLAAQRPEPAGPGTVVGDRAALAGLPAPLRARWLLAALDAIDRTPRRARAALDRFAQLLPTGRRFTLDLEGARVSAGRVEVRVAVRTGRGPRTR